MVEHGTPNGDGSANKLGKRIFRSKGSCKFSNKNRLGTRQFKRQKIKQNSKTKNSRNTNKNNSNNSINRDKHNNAKCVYLNARSIVNKQKELELLITEEELDIVGITETWLNDKISDEELHIKGYTLLRNDRNDNIKSRGGGVVLYVRNELHPIHKTDLTELNFPESIWCSINCNGENTLIGVCYRAPDSSEINDIALYSLLNRVKNQRVVVLGDFNYPEINWNQDDTLDAAHPFIECLGNNFLFQLVEEPTRGKKFLDLVLSSDDSIVQKLQVGEPFESSDHQVIRFELICEKRTLEKNLKIYDYFKADYNEIRKYAESLNWGSINKLNINSVDEIWAEIKTNLADVKDKFINLKRKTKNKCKWVTKRVTRFRNAKKKAWNNYIKSGKESSLYEVYKKKLKVSINENKVAKQSFEEKLANNIKNDSKSFYAYVGSKKRVNNKVGPLRDNSKQILNSNIENANLLNAYFSSVFTVENLNSIPAPIKLFSENSDQTLTNIDITEDIVLEKLNKINVSKCQGSDQLHPKLLYELRNEIVIPLTMLFTLSLQLGIVPQDWREANVAPLHKKGSREKPENYRPVSLTSIVGKILESIIKDSVVSHLNQYNLINKSQHGFTRGKSCLTNLLDFFEVVTKELDEGNNVDLIYLDFSKAFDKVPYKRLFTKLESHGISGNILNWIKIWLSDRRQRVCIDGEYSEWVEVTSGVPQGSVLGPILFIVYINDLDCNVISKLDKFADDSKLGKSLRSQDDVECLRKDLANMEKWSNDWQMKFNTDKCTVMHLGRNNMASQYILNDKKLKESESERDLGVIIDKNLKFSDHCNKVANTANVTLGMIRRTINCKSKSIITRLYKALVRPQLEYCVQAWRPYLKKDIEKIEKVQRRATKMISDCSKLSYEERLKITGLSTLEARRNRGDLIEVFKLLKGFSKVDYKHFFQLVDNSKTRGNKYKLVKSRSRLDIRKHFFSQRVVNEWNKLPNSVVEAESVNSFKNKYDIYVSLQRNHT